jgi:hypothetical protein
MLIVALVLAVIGLAALITAVVTSNEVVAWVCIAASALGVVLLIIDAVRERAQGRLGALAAAADEADEDADDAEAAPFTADADTELIEYSDEIVEPVVVEPVVVEPVVVEPVVVDPAIEAEDHPEELVHDEPEYDLPTDDEPEFAESAEESAIHIVDEQSGSDDQLVVLQTDDLPDSTAVIEYGDTGYDRDAR